MAASKDTRATFTAVVKGDSSQAVTEFRKLGGEVQKSTSGASSAVERFKMATKGALADIKANAGKLAVAAGVAFAAFADDVLRAGVAMEAMDAKASTVFGDQIGQINKWADANAGAMGLTERQARGAAAGIADLLKPMGFTTAQATAQTVALLDLSGALSAWSGGSRSAADVAQILTKAMLGEREQLKELGISITEAEVQSRLAATGQAKLTGAALAQAKALETQRLIQEKSVDAQKAWADGSMDGVKAANEAQASFKEMGDMVVEALYPALKELVPIVQDVVEAISPLLEVLGQVVGAIETVTSTLGLGQGEWEANTRAAIDAAKAQEELTGNFTDIKNALNLVTDATATSTSAYATGAAALAEYRTQISGLYGDLQTVTNAQLGYDGAVQNLLGSLDRYFRTQDDANTLQDESAVALQAVARQAMDTAAQYATMNGHALDSKEGIDDQIQSLSFLASTLDPNDKLRTWLNGYIGELQRIPTQVSTNVTTTLSKRSTPWNTGGVQARASGGPAGGRTWVGERGPELVDLPAGSWVHNAGESAAMVRRAASSGGGGGGSAQVINIPVSISAAPGTDRARLGREFIDYINAAYAAGAPKLAAA